MTLTIHLLYTIAVELQDGQHTKWYRILVIHVR